MSVAWKNDRFVSIEAPWTEADNQDPQAGYKRLGYEFSTRYGDTDDDFEFGIELWKRVTGDHPYEFLAFVQEGQNNYEVFLPDFSARLKFLAAVVPSLLAAGAYAKLKDTHRIVSCMFRVQHGQDHTSETDACSECDPRQVAVNKALYKKFCSKE